MMSLEFIQLADVTGPTVSYRPGCRRTGLPALWRCSGMQRRTFLKALAGLPLLSRFAASAGDTAVRPTQWVRPGEPGWPSPAEWAKLRTCVGGRLVKVQSAFAVCEPNAGSTACTDVFQNLTDPFYIDQSVNLTQTLGWMDAFTSEPSAYAVLAQSGADVAAAVNFASKHRVRLVVKGGGHSYLGASNAPDSLLIWTRPNMQAIEVHDRFVPRGAAGLRGLGGCGPARSGWMPITRPPPSRAATCRAGAAPPSVSPAWCRAAVSAASRRVSAPPLRTCWRRRSSPRTGPCASPTRPRTRTCSGHSRAAEAGPSASSPGSPR